MKKSILILFFIFSILSAETYTTITVNGTNSGWASDETFTDISAADNAYVTWDATNIYIGIKDAEIDYNNQACFLYFDTDPTGSNGSTDAYAWTNNITTPFSADYVLVFKFNSTEGSAYIEFRDYDDNGSSWSQTGATSSYTYNTDNAQMAGGTDYLEFKIKRSILGVTSATDKIRFCMFTEQQWSSYYRYFVFPGSSDIGNRGSSQSISNYKSFTLGDVFSPDLSKVTIYGNDGFRMMSSPVAGTVYDDILGDLWIQGMTNGDTESGTANVWTYSGSSWSALSNLNTASQTAGVGFLVYVYANTDGADDDSDLPVALSVSGTENSGSVEVPSSGANLADDAWLFAGNPYASTIDWDLVEQTNVTTSVYVWDDAASAYKTWNGSSGALSNGLIAPFQGFWVQGDGGSGGITIATADKSASSGIFYKTMTDNTGSMNFTITSGNYSDRAFVSFMTNGAEGMDNSDAYKLLPMSPSERVVGISYAEGNGLDISNLPSSHEGSIAIPLDVMYLTVDDDYNFVTNENDVSMTWDISSLPGHVSLTLTDNVTGTAVNLTEESEIIFLTEAKGSFLSYGTDGVNIYPQVGESRFTLTVAYSALTSNDEPANVPGSFALHPAYPNPFNPSTTISFDIPDAADRNTSFHIYDITGKLVETLVNKVLSSGSHAVTWDPKNLSSGLYILQLKVGNKTFNQKLTFLK
jgi:hypothetical protein